MDNIGQSMRARLKRWGEQIRKRLAFERDWLIDLTGLLRGGLAIRRVIIGLVRLPGRAWNGLKDAVWRWRHRAPSAPEAGASWLLRALPVVVLAPRDQVYDKVISNIQEIKARRGNVIAIATEGDTYIPNLVNDVIYIPEANDFVLPLLSIIPLQLLAYHVAVLRGCDVDQPRNLAKSVTVE